MTEKKKSNNIHGVLLIDKPSGMTSYDVIRILKKKLNTNRIGHCGTLDPFATGLLIICIGKYTKLASFIEAYSKKYIAKAMLGIKTDSYDLDGKVIEERDVDINIKELLDTVLSFSGIITQTPPHYSAVKINGVRAYDLARQGESFEIKSRRVNIFNIELNDFTPPYFTFSVHCEKGTYIRSIANDIGDKLKCGCHLVELKRIQIGEFHIRNAVSLEETSDVILNSLLNAKDVLYQLPDLVIKNEYEKYIIHGKELKDDFFKNKMPEFPSLCKIINENNFVLAIVEYNGNNNIKYKKVLAL